MRTEHQRPEGRLIETRAKRAGLSARSAAKRAGISDARWRQIINGYQAVSPGNVAPVLGPPDTIARMARVVGATADDLRDVGRADAAEVYEEVESHRNDAPSPADRLAGLRDELDAIIGTLRSAEGPRP